MMANPFNEPRYLDMFGNENFYAWKLCMFSLLKKGGYWKLVIDEGVRPSRENSTKNTPRNIQNMMTSRELGVNDSTNNDANNVFVINKNLPKWMEHAYNVFFQLLLYSKMSLFDK